jgi:hypothetical protein
MNAAYAVSAVTAEETEIALISRTDFQRFCMEHPEVALKMVAVDGCLLPSILVSHVHCNFVPDDASQHGHCDVVDY